MPRFCSLLALLALAPAVALSQDKLPSYPGYDRYKAVEAAAGSLFPGGVVSVAWDKDGQSFVFDRGGKYFRYSFVTHQETPAEPTDLETVEEGHARLGWSRGHQYGEVASPDGKLTAVSKNRNVFIVKNGVSTAITTDGNAASRIKYGTASWVYGEELDQIDAMWWSPDGSKLAYYRFDESKVKDYYTLLNQGTFQDTVSGEAYPQPGDPNPNVGIVIYDLATRRNVRVETNLPSKLAPDMGEYVYAVDWTPDGKSLIFFRMNRRQNAQELVAADPETGKCRIVYQRSNSNGWIPYRSSGEWPSTIPERWWLPDGRFLTIIDDSGYRNIEICDLSHGFLKALTHNPFDVRTILRVDFDQGLVWYTSQGADNPYLVQLHRVRLADGEDTLLTDPAFSHRVSVSPAGVGFVDIEQTYDDPPVSYVCDLMGRKLATLSSADLTKFNELGLKRLERFTCKAADGVTDIHGFIAKPSNFDPSKKYPLLLYVYAGPSSGTEAEEFGAPPALTELGFIFAWIDGRGSIGRGRAFNQAVFHALGTVEIDDQAAGVRYLVQRPYIDSGRVGIVGTSYGGYAALMGVLRYPDTFYAAYAGSPVTDWRNYDSVYTERYMGLLDTERPAYDKASVLPLAKSLRRPIFLYYGTADDNVHPSNTLMLLRELDADNKSYRLAVGTDQGHGSTMEARFLEFFLETFHMPKG